MKTYTKKDYITDFKELDNFKESFQECVGSLIKINEYRGDYCDKRDAEKPVIFPSIMYNFDVKQNTFRTPRKTLFKNAYGTIFISTSVNPNGIDSSKRIGRTWTISFEICGDTRRYRHKQWYKESFVKKRVYSENMSDAISQFLTYLNSLSQETKNIIGFLTEVQD